MRISATVEVSNRLLPTLNMTHRRPEKSYLSLGFLPGQRAKVFVLHQTIRNCIGIKYKVNDNLLAVFIKFISEGKATLRFKEPPVDLIIKGEAKSLLSFIKVLKQFLEKKVPLKVLQLSNLAGAPSKVESKQSVKLIIKQKKELPIFPRNLEILQINDVMMMKLDSRILRLQKLRVLNLEGNCLEDIPKQIDLLPCLEELYLAKNCIGLKTKYAWICGPSISSSLIHLDLRDNQISYLPHELCRLKNLKTLLLDNNSIKKLPNGLGRLSKLKKLSVSNNNLKWMPGSCQFLRLNHLDVSKNSWSHETYNNRSIRSLKLVDIAAVSVLRHRIEFNAEMIPRTLVYDLENAGYCSCGIPTFPSQPNKIVPLDRYLTASECITIMGEEVQMIAFTTCQLH